MDNETEQRVLLASHRAQLNGLEQSIAQIERQKLDGTLPAEVADQMIASWQQQVAQQRVFVDNCLRSLGELPVELEQPAESDIAEDLPDASAEHPPAEPAKVTPPKKHSK